MDPQSAAFTPRDDVRRWQEGMFLVQQVQAEHAERLLRLERRQDDDARMKSVWGASSPFPGILSGTPQQGESSQLQPLEEWKSRFHTHTPLSAPLSQPPTDAFTGFDDQQTNLIGSLHLDAEEEPRRMGATSRANSVRFDESANQGHWSHASRTSIDLIPRTGSGLAHPMIERTYSHKSDGRQSSAGHSVHSMASGRANSLGIDTTFGLSHSNASPTDLPGFAPGLFVLGSVPSIIRCWLTTKFKHDSLLYAAVCTGSHTSYLGSRLIETLGLDDRIIDEGDGIKKVKLDVYLPEAVTHPAASSRSSSPAPQVPSINVEFTVQDTSRVDQDSKAIQIFVGSDVLRAHNADVLFSSNTVTLFDDERTKMSVPLVRPEDERAFKSLCTVSSEAVIQPMHMDDNATQADVDRFNGHSSNAPESVHSGSERALSAALPGLSSRTSRPGPPGFDLDQDSVAPASATSSSPQLDTGFSGPSASTASEQPAEPKPRTSSESSFVAPRSSGPSPAIWSNWRREPSTDTKTPPLDWASAGRGNSSGSSTTYQRRDQGIKVLKPVKPSASSRTASSSQAATGASTPASATDKPQSRFFDDGKRRPSNAGADVGGEMPPPQQLKRLVSNEVKGGKEKEKDGAGGGKSRNSNTNPVGGASAFSWLKGGGPQGSGAASGR